MVRLYTFWVPLTVPFKFLVLFILFILFHTFFIHLAHDVVLGRDFLTNFESTIDLANYRLHLASPPPLPTISSIPSKASLHAPDQLLVLPPRTETVFPISCDQLPGTQGLVTPAQQLQNKYKLAGAHLLCSVSPTKTIPFRILNPNPYAVVLYPNTTLGEFESIESQISTIHSFENHSSEPLQAIRVLPYQLSVFQILP